MSTHCQSPPATVNNSPSRIPAYIQTLKQAKHPSPSHQKQSHYRTATHNQSKGPSLAALAQHSTIPNPLRIALPCHRPKSSGQTVSEMSSNCASQVVSDDNPDPGSASIESTRQATRDTWRRSAFAAVDRLFILTRLHAGPDALLQLRLISHSCILLIGREPPAAAYGLDPSMQVSVDGGRVACRLGLGSVLFLTSLI